MPGSDLDSSPVARKAHINGDAAAAKLVSKADKHVPSALPDNSVVKPPGQQKKGPAGGYDETPVPRAPPGYTVKFTFHRAQNLPFADFGSFSADPYLVATMYTKLQPRHKADPKLKFRTFTVRKSTDPEWNTEWVVANVPASGFHLKCRLYDEDPADHDDRLGNVHVHCHGLDEKWGINEQSFGIKKRMGSKRAYFVRGAAAVLTGVKFHGNLIISAEVLGRTQTDNGGRIYTVGPCHWSKHFSPLFGRLVGIKDSDSGNQDGKRQRERYNFQANQIQLKGPTPDAMYHRYVEFKPFIKGMYTATSLRGRILNRALHHQHARIYNYDRSTVYGYVDGPSEEMTKAFLELAHWDKGGRMFTYVITLDGQMRFTETGKEFAVDLLSKHVMHADCDNWVAFSGEFFIRRMKQPWTPGRHRSRSGLHEVEDNSSPESSPFASPFPSPRPGDTQESQNYLTPFSPSQESPGPRSRGHSHSSVQTPTDPQSNTQLRPQTPLSPNDARSSSQSQSRHWWSRSRSHSHQSTTPTPLSPPPPHYDPSFYHLIIDNDSGTYRPNADLLPALRTFLRSQFPGLRVSTLDCQADADRMSRLKREQYERKAKAKGGKTVAYIQAGASDDDTSSSDGGWSSSDEEHLDEAVRRQSGAHNNNTNSAGKRRNSSKTGAGSSSIKKVWRAVKDPKREVLAWAGADRDNGVKKQIREWEHERKLERRGSTGMSQEGRKDMGIRKTRTADGLDKGFWGREGDGAATVNGAGHTTGNDTGSGDDAGGKKVNGAGLQGLNTAIPSATVEPHTAPPDAGNAKGFESGRSAIGIGPVPAAARAQQRANGVDKAGGADRPSGLDEKTLEAGAPVIKGPVVV